MLPRSFAYLLFLTSLTLSSISLTSLTTSSLLDKSLLVFENVVRGTAVLRQIGSTETVTEQSGNLSTVLNYIRHYNSIKEKIRMKVKKEGLEVHTYRVGLIGTFLAFPLESLPQDLREKALKRMEGLKIELRERGYNESTIERALEIQRKFALVIPIEPIGIGEGFPKHLLPFIKRGTYPSTDLECAITSSIFSALERITGPPETINITVTRPRAPNKGTVQSVVKSYRVVGIMEDVSPLVLMEWLSLNRTVLMTEKGLSKLSGGDLDETTDLRIVVTGDPTELRRKISELNNDPLLRDNGLVLVPTSLFMGRMIQEAEERVDRITNSLRTIGVITGPVILIPVIVILMKRFRREFALEVILGRAWGEMAREVLLKGALTVLMGSLAGAVLGSFLGRSLSEQILSSIGLPIMSGEAALEPLVPLGMTAIYLLVAFLYVSRIGRREVSSVVR